MLKSLTAKARWAAAGLLAAAVAWGCVVVEPTKPPPTATPAPPPATPTPILPVSDPAAAGVSTVATQPAPAAPAAGGGVAVAAAQGDANPENRPECCPAIQLGGLLTAAAWLDADRMYLADWDGRIRLLNVPTGEIKTALEGLTIPQGLTVLDGRLYLAEMGNVCAGLPTAAERAACQPLVQWPDGERLAQLAQSRARVLSYRITAAGLLDDPQIVVDGIVSDSWDHGPKSLTNDGEWVYISIGHPYQGPPGTQADFLKVGAEPLAAAGGRPDLMGVIARFRPADGELQVYATGFRNTVGLTRAPDGHLYGADNAAPGPAAGPRQELNAVIQGGFYGYPAWGTNAAPPAELVREPVAMLHGTAATAAYANEQGLYTAYLTAEEDGAGFVIDRFDYDTFTPTRIFSGAAGYITAILEREGLLYLVTFYGQIQVINPEQSAAANRSQFASEFSAELDKVIREREPDISFNYAVYAAEGQLIYLQDPCPPGEVNRRFFLHIDPVSQEDLPEYRREYGFDNLDFRFGDYGTRSGNRCLAAVPLPRYPIANIWTGYNEAWHWEGHIDLK